ncbi:MAG TPA: hypothetical protein VI248_05945 [Kineosporiaceae bacterium]
MTRHWVVLETGANQDYIFDSNRMRHVVGASQVVLDAGTRWVEQACEGVGGVEPVQLVSGKAVLLAPSEEAGREVIRAVSARVLTEAPRLELTGVVGPPFDEDARYVVRSAIHLDSDGPAAHHVEALRRTLIRQGQARAARPARQLRDQYLPWHEPCRETSLPAAGFELFAADPRDNAWHPASAATLARSTARKRPETRERLKRLLGRYPELLPALVDELADETMDDGWIAVVHADGNGVGTLLHDFPDAVGDATGTSEVSLDQHTRWLKDFSDHLEQVTRAAFTAAVEAAVDAVRAMRPDWRLKGRLLPILLGGDDVTFACHAALALPLVRTFLREFARRTREDDVMPRIAGPNGLTAAAGIAIVKRHHPFSAAYDLAEDLVSSAKRRAVRQVTTGEPVSAYDVHVAHESTLRGLRELRQELTLDSRRGGPVARHGGPYVVRETDDASVPAAVAHRDERHLLDLMDLLAGGTLSSARAHDLRGALDRGVDEYRSRLTVALARTARERDARGGTFDRTATERLLSVVTEPAPPATEPASDDAAERPSRFVRLPDALLLHGVLPAALVEDPDLVVTS